ncbi:MAG: putative flagellar associated protein, partial [Streblomastix strix]
MKPLALEIAQFSSQEADRPASNLADKQQDEKNPGWQSKQGAKFPQEIIFKLKNGPAHISGVKIMSHEFKIGKRVELHMGVPKDGNAAQSPDDCDFIVLGHTSLDKNETNKYKFSELKSIDLDTYALYLKLVIPEIHTNSLNQYTQVGIRQVRVEGDLINGNEEQLIKMKEMNSSQRRRRDEEQNRKLNSDYGVIASRIDIGEALLNARDANIEASIKQLGLEGKLDGKTKALLRELIIKKDQAVQEEDFDAAKKWKMSIEKMKEVAIQLSELEQKKDQAVKAEDFDTAKKFKIEIEKLRQQVVDISDGKTNQNSNSNQKEKDKEKIIEKDKERKINQYEDDFEDQDQEEDDQIEQQIQKQKQ